MMMGPSQLNLLVLLSSLLNLLSVHSAYSTETQEKPNIVVILTDDQDLLLNSVSSLPSLNNIFVENGLHFINAFASSPVCCVSRSSILSGKYIHNHATTNQSQDGGCYDDIWVKQYEPITFNTFLHNNGYKTLYSGKYLNEYCSVDNYNNVDVSCSHIPTGWDEWFVTAGGAKFYDYYASLNGEKLKFGTDESTDYFPELQRQHALDWLDTLSNINNNEKEEDSNGLIPDPFLMVLATPAAHSPFTPSEEYKSLVYDLDLEAPQSMSSFNYINNDDKGPIVRNRNGLDDSAIDDINFMYRMRHATLLTVDDMVRDIYNKLYNLNELDNTYFIYLSDHGFHLGQYGLLFGKKLLYEPDIRIPFFINSPETRKGSKINENYLKTNIFASTIDIAATVAELGIGYVPESMDGQSLVKFVENYEKYVMIQDMNDMMDIDEIEDDLDENDNEYRVLTDNNDNNERKNSIRDYNNGQSLQQAFLIEYNGESGANGKIDDNVIINEVYQTEYISESYIIPFSFAAENVDTWNNTYSCVRYDDGSYFNTNLNNIDGSFSITGEIYCKYTCFDRDYNVAECLETHFAEYNGEYYNFNIDPSQTVNQINYLSKDRREFFDRLLDKLLKCQGSECNKYRILDDDMIDLIESNNIDNNNNNIFSHNSSKNNSSNHLSWAFYVVVTVLGVNSIIVGIICCVCGFYIRRQENDLFEYMDSMITSEKSTACISKEGRESEVECHYNSSSDEIVNEHTVLLSHKSSQNR